MKFKEERRSGEGEEEEGAKKQRGRLERRKGVEEEEGLKKRGDVARGRAADDEDEEDEENVAAITVLFAATAQAGAWRRNKHVIASILRRDSRRLGVREAGEKGSSKQK